jgi:YVTN family beta-propeller protein
MTVFMNSASTIAASAFATATRSGSVTATISLGDCSLLCPRPNKVAINPTTGNVYVAGASPSDTVAGTIWVVNSQTNQVIASIPLSDQASAIAVNPRTGNAYVANGQSISVIDGRTNQVIASISGFTNPSGIAVNPLTDNVYVSDFFTKLVYVINGQTNRVTVTINAPSSPQAPFPIAVNAITGNIYVVGNINNIQVIDGRINQVIASIAIQNPNPNRNGDVPFGVAVNPLTGKFSIGWSRKYFGN